MRKVKPILNQANLASIGRSILTDYMVLHRANVLGYTEQTLVRKTVLISLKSLIYLRVCHHSFMNKCSDPLLYANLR